MAPNRVIDQCEVEAFLADPDTHGGQSVERFNTHGAMVFLAGDRAYKIKRAVAFPYMDFSTLAKRRSACENEIAFNRRTAPELYLRVAPITRTEDGELSFGGDGEVIEWAVVMKRFDQAGLFDRLAQENRLGPPLITELADAIADFHRKAEPVRFVSGPGEGIKTLSWVIDETLEALQGRSDLFDSEAVETVAGQVKEHFEAVSGLLDERSQAGYVRRCHGDLHLRNICLVDQKPTLFDCIEFNDEIAKIDVLYDLAFLLMDLDQRGLRPAANLLLNRYLQRTADYSGLSTLPLFLGLRALVRAKVSATMEALETDASRRTALRQEAEVYFAKAKELLHPLPPVLVAVGGLSGAGKSTLARKLAPAIGAAPGAVHLRSDVIRKELWGQDELTPLPEAAYNSAQSKRVYSLLMARAETVLKGGQAVIVDAVYGKPQERDAVRALADKLELPFFGLWLEADPEILISRVRARTGDASDATGAVVRRQLSTELGEITWQPLDANLDLERLLAKAMASISS